MDRTEFIYGLRRALSGKADAGFINDTVEYYESYIDTEIRKGTPEEEVMAQLGDPKLIAKSIITSRGAEERSENIIDDEPKQERRNVFEIKGRTINLPVWATYALGGVIVVVLAILAILALQVILPVAIVGFIALVVYRFIRDNFMR